ncbi:MAG: PaaI family thioesterase [Pikeienuella sp.]
MEFRDDLDWLDYRPKGFNAYVGPFFIGRLTDTEYRMHLNILDHHLNQGDVVHGGVSMTLMDNAMGIAAHYAGGKPVSTIEFSAKFIAAAKADGPLYGKAIIERQTKDVCFLTGELWSHGRKTLTASGVWKYISPKGAADGWAASGS